jgi:hypothetical protein
LARNIKVKDVFFTNTYELHCNLPVGVDMGELGVGKCHLAIA